MMAPGTLQDQFNQTGKLPDATAGLLANDENAQNAAENGQDMDRTARQEEELMERRQIIADKTLISAVKIVVELRRA